MIDQRFLVTRGRVAKINKFYSLILKGKQKLHCRFPRPGNSSDGIVQSRHDFQLIDFEGKTKIARGLPYLISSGMELSSSFDVLLKTLPDQLKQKIQKIYE